ncbi:MAG: hypothetical protein KGK02_01505 [Rhodospirillales bacterium]|nr:hypothetical protein [Rhodospirillales bacterium]
MRRPGIPPRRIVVLFSLAALLAGCVARPASSPQPIPDITLNDLKTAIHDAYQQGFVAGRHYQREVDWRRPGAPKAAALDQKSQPASALPQPDALALEPSAAQAAPPSAALPSKSFAPAPQPAPLPPLPPSASFTTSGPAQPLQ